MIPSSISSSERDGGDRLPAGVALALAAALFFSGLAVIAWLRPDAANPIDPPGYFRMKLAWSNVADAVVLGNSQVYRSVDPDAFAGACPAIALRNYGFAGALMRRDYLESAAAALRDDGPRLLLVGINPMQFKDERDADGYTQSRSHEAQFKFPWRFERALAPLLVALRPLEKPLAIGPLIRWEYRDNGYVLADMPQLHLKDEAKYERDYLARPFSSRMYEDMLRTLVRLQSEGHRVLLFATYSSPAFERVDARMSGLDDQRLAQDAASHGLGYLPLATSGLRSWDGTHLDSRSAALFGERLGQAVAKTLGADACGVQSP